MAQDLTAPGRARFPCGSTPHHGPMTMTKHIPAATWRRASGAEAWERAAYLARRLSNRAQDHSWPDEGVCFALALACIEARDDRLVLRQKMARIHWIWIFRLSPFPKLRRLASGPRYVDMILRPKETTP